jgi:hypothetical protein
VTYRVPAPTEAKATKAVPPILDDCLSAAESHAERFFGEGSVPHWRPSFHLAPWAAGAFAAIAVVALTLAWTWNPVAAPGGAEAVVVASGAQQAQAVPNAKPAANALATESQLRGAIGCGAVACRTEPQPRVRVVPNPSGTDASRWPSDPDGWALDPQTLGASVEQAPSVRHYLHNNPVVPDDADPTPGGESQPDDDQGGGPID